MTKTVLITRPYEDEAVLAAKIKQLGFKVISEPLLKIEYRQQSINDVLSQNQNSVLLITSANSLRALAKVTDERNFNIITIGNASLSQAKELGFNNANSILENNELQEGNIENMLAFILKHYERGAKFLYLSGSTISYNLSETLQQSGYIAERVELYDANPADEFSERALQELQQGRVHIVIFYSKRTAEVFDALCRKASLKGHLHRLKILTLSQKITNLLIEKGWSNIQTASLPDEDSIIEKLKAMSVEPRIIENKPKPSLWKYFIPFTFFLLSLVLILQNIMLNKKIDNIFSTIQKSINDDLSQNVAKVAAMDEKISTVLSGFDTTPLKENKQNFDEIKALLQDMRGLTFDGNGNVGPKDIIVEETPKASAEYKVTSNTNANLDQYIAELDKLETQISTYDASQEELRKLVYTASEEVLKEYNSRNVGPEVAPNQEKSIISGFVKVRKITETKPDSFVEKVKAADELFEAGDYLGSRAAFEAIALEVKNDKIPELSAKLKEFAENPFTPEQLLTRLTGLVKGIKKDISK